MCITECVDAYFKRGNTHSFKKDLRAAIKDYNQVIQIDSNYALAYVKRSYIRKTQGHNKEAIEDLQLAINIFYQKSMLSEVKNLPQVIRSWENEIKNTPGWKTKIF